MAARHGAPGCGLPEEGIADLVEAEDPRRHDSCLERMAGARLEWMDLNSRY